MNVPTLPGSAPTGSAPAAGRTGAPEGGEVPAGFTAMLVDALAGEGSDSSLADPEAIDLGTITDLAAALEDLAPADGTGEGEVADGEVAAEALAALLLSGSGTRPELVAAVRAWRQQATGSDVAASGPNGAAPTGAPVIDAAPGAGAPAMTSTAESEQLATGTPATAPASASSSTKTPSTMSAKVEIPSSGASSPATSANAATPTLPTTAADRARQAVAESPARAAVDGGEAPAPSPVASTPASSTAAPASASPAPAAPDASLHARLVSRVIQAAEALENAPPPRTMMVELPDGEGLRLQVSLRGTEVHVQLQGAAGQGTDLGAWGRELAAGLAGRGLSLGQFQTGAEGERGQGQDQAPTDDLSADDDRTPSRPADRSATDGALRL